MSIARYCLTRKIVVVASVLAAIQPLIMQSASESDRLEKLERAVEQLQKRNAELEAEVRSLKKQTASVPEGKMKTKITYDGKTYVEKAVVEEKAPVARAMALQATGPPFREQTFGSTGISFLQRKSKSANIKRLLD
jgi:hypothetical protein